MFFSVAIYQDNSQNLIMIPFSFDKNGVRRNVNKPEIANVTDSFEEIGEKLTRCFEVCQCGPYDIGELVINVHEEVTGEGWKKFFKKRRSISARLNPESGYSFVANSKGKNESYIATEYRLELNLSANEIELGMAMLKTLEHSS